ncbi:MAG: GNAT family N-acetyltransferase [Acidobacteriota bacterium]|nr:GNAT family N-acetyltransferase [Acidobacteriota bacterium]
MASMSIREASSADIPAVRALIDEYCRWIGLDLTFQEIQPELDGLPGDYAPPGGVLLVGTLDDRVEGVAAYRRFDTQACEMKRLYVRPSGRGRGVARALVMALMANAVSRGFRTMYLDTLPTMGSAQRLYESLGFQDTPAYYDTPIAGTRFMARQLRG